MRPDAEKVRPMGVLILAILQILSGIQLLLGSIWFLAISARANTAEIQERLIASSPQWVVDNADSIFFGLGLIAFAMTILSFVMAYGYLKGRTWARRRGIGLAIFSISYAILGILALPDRIDPGSPFWTIVFNLIVVFYLTRMRIKEYFKSR